MIYITKNSINPDVVVTLQEKSQLYTYSGINPYYMFSLTSDTTGNVVNFVATETNAVSARTRYDQFTWIETGSTFTNLTGGTINLTPSDFWTYKAYEQLVRDNIDPSLAYGEVESGKVMVIPNPFDIQAPNIYFNPTGNTQIITFSEY